MYQRKSATQAGGRSVDSSSISPRASLSGNKDDSASVRSSHSRIKTGDSSASVRSSNSKTSKSGASAKAAETTARQDIHAPHGTLTLDQLTTEYQHALMKIIRIEASLGPGFRDTANDQKKFAGSVERLIETENLPLDYNEIVTGDSVTYSSAQDTVDDDNLTRRSEGNASGRFSTSSVTAAHGLSDRMLSALYIELKTRRKERVKKFERLLKDQGAVDLALKNIFSNNNIPVYEQMSDAEKMKYEILYLQAHYPNSFKIINSWRQKQSSSDDVEDWGVSVRNKMSQLYAYSGDHGLDNKENFLSHVWNLPYMTHKRDFFHRVQSHYNTVINVWDATQKESLDLAAMINIRRRIDRLDRRNEPYNKNHSAICNEMRVAIASAWPQQYSKEDEEKKLPYYFDFNKDYNNDAWNSFTSYVDSRKDLVKECENFKNKSGMTPSLSRIDAEALPKTALELQALVYFIFKKQDSSFSYANWLVQENRSINIEWLDDCGAVVKIIAGLEFEPALYFVVLLSSIAILNTTSIDLIVRKFFCSKIEAACNGQYNNAPKPNPATTNKLTLAGFASLLTFFPATLPGVDNEYKDTMAVSYENIKKLFSS